MPLSPADLNMLVLLSLPEAAIGEIRRVAPGIHVHCLTRQDPRYAELVPQAHIVVGGIPADDIPKARNLRWLQIGSAGAGRYTETLPEHVILTNASGVFGIPIGEHIFAMMLALARAIPEAVRAMAEARWKQDALRTELHGTTCGIVGMGDIGTETARRAKAFGMRVLATRRTTTTKPAFVDELWDASGLDRLLAESDHVVNCLPGTPHTHHLIDARRIGLMKPGAFYYSVGRGSTTDEAALIEALQAGRLAGAGLDVFETEPLPSDSPLWRMPNVIVTPHRSGSTPRHGERLAEILIPNLERFLRGEPLQNVVDRQWGY